jgi:hypothetical protein
MISMTQDRHIDVIIADPEKTANINFSQSLYSFSMNLGSFHQVLYEAEKILVLIFDRGEIRIELSLEEICTKRTKNKRDLQ